MSNLTYYLKVGLISLITLIVTVGLIVMYFTGSFSKIKNYVYEHIGPAPTQLSTAPSRIIVLAKTNKTSIPGIKNISVAIEKIELMNKDKEWVNINSTGTSTLLLDPVKNKGLGQVIANANNIPSGSYSAVRYTFGDVSVIQSDNATTKAILPSKVLTIPTEVSIDNGTISTISIAFVPRQSIYGKANNYTFAPQAVIETHSNALVFTTSDNSIAISTSIGTLDHISTVQTYNDGSTSNKLVAINKSVATPKKPSSKVQSTDDETFNINDQTYTEPVQENYLVFSPVLDQYVTAGSPLSFKVQATNNSGAAITYNAPALPSGASFNPTTSTFSWTPNTNGIYAANFTAADGYTTASLTVAIIVSNSTTVVINPSPSPSPSPSISPSTSPSPSASPSPSPSPSPAAVTTYAYTWQPPQNYSASSMPHILPFFWLNPWDPNYVTNAKQWLESNACWPPCYF